MSNILCPIPRSIKREEIGIDSTTPLPFFGYDLWNHYEVSWLNPRGKPLVATAQIVYNCDSFYIVESKSLKLYFNALNNRIFKDVSHFRDTITSDLSTAINSAVHICIDTNLLGQDTCQITRTPGGLNIDDLDIVCDTYTVTPEYLSTTDEYADEVLYSDLLRSNCLMTHQPDWGSIEIAYRGLKIQHEGLLRYIISYRNHNEFHEQCIERMFMDMMKCCKPEQLSIYGRYTRRGGIDINPYRSSMPDTFPRNNSRHTRQ